MTSDPSAPTSGRLGEPPAPAWQTRFFEWGDETQVAPMLGRAFGTWPRGEITVSPEEHLRWKLSSHPKAAWQCVVTESGKRVVGFQGYVFADIKVDDSILLARVSVDFAVDPDYQRQGIKQGMRERAFINNPRRVFDVHFGPDSDSPAFAHIRRKRNVPRQPRLAHRVESRVLRMESCVPAESGPPGWDIRQADAFDDRVDVLWDVASKPFRAALVRKAAFLNWRYADTRAGRYKILIAEHEGRLLGYVVTRISREHGYLTDIFVLPERIDDVGESLVAEAMSVLRREGAVDVECWLPEHHPYWQAICRLPFDRKRRTVSFALMPETAQPEAATIPFLDDPRAPLHITLGDSDVG